MYGNAVTGGVFLSESLSGVRGWMVQRRVLGCSCVNAHVHVYTKSQRFVPFKIKIQMHFSQKRLC